YRGGAAEQRLGQREVGAERQLGGRQGLRRGGDEPVAGQVGEQRILQLAQAHPERGGHRAENGVRGGGRPGRLDEDERAGPAGRATTPWRLRPAAPTSIVSRVTSSYTTARLPSPGRRSRPSRWTCSRSPSAPPTTTATSASGTSIPSLSTRADTSVRISPRR